MDGTELARLSQVELWAARHEAGCEGRHNALKLRLDTLDATAAEVKRDLGTRLKSQDLWAAVRFAALVVLLIVAPHLEPGAVLKMIGLVK